MKTISPPVFYYHSVAPKKFEGWTFNFLTIRLQSFERHLVYLKQNNLQAIFLDDWLAIRKGEKTPVGNEVCLTFDDGYLDNWVYAFPVAKKYGMRFTLFVNPEFIDPRPLVRPTLEDVWSGKCDISALEERGFVTWSELKIMQESGVVDIQSHTMSHDKYIASPNIECFYYGGARGTYPILNAFREIKTAYISDSKFEQRLPFGTPLFEEDSAVTVKKHTVNQEFISEIDKLAKKQNLAEADERPTFENAARQLAKDFERSGKLLDSIESEADYQARLRYEIVDSKAIIEEKLKKPVQFLCWPHGDNNQQAHELAKENGYFATTSGKMLSENDKTDRIPRVGADFKEEGWLGQQKLHYKIAAHYRRQPWYGISKINDFKNQLLQKR